MELNESKNVESIIENDFARIRLEDGMLVGEYKPVVINLRGAKEVVRDRKIASENKTTPILIDARKVKEITKEARDYFGSDEGSELLSAAAIYVDSVLTTFLANFVIKISFFKRPIPIKMFTDRDKAIEWLMQYREEG